MVSEALVWPSSDLALDQLGFRKKGMTTVICLLLTAMTGALFDLLRSLKATGLLDCPVAVQDDGYLHQMSYSYYFNGEILDTPEGQADLF